ncbi:DNA-binding transcription factor Zip1-like [Schizosaccharomyces osmophilus]|uniref:DNA-binding transcription factor Zip1-like n=1 Tax=Schizosaccharomyces osmophilus TaxID=2545709 RepID=A0AAE9WCP5_9SCHI|nr:DNA-binding transcription factor Zip1-like [Schizosaccharomyces osmophilus]WBW72747.1 DNA-binding transcription factor Zip1-like [Schizosaccharomyces osmophilus]
MESNSTLPTRAVIPNATEYIPQEQPVSPKSNKSYREYLDSKEYSTLQYIKSAQENGFQIAYGRNGHATTFPPNTNDDDLPPMNALELELEQKHAKESAGEENAPTADFSGNESSMTSPFEGMVGVVEDKERRRRNTLASARFRQRRKAKEQYLEQTVQEYEKKIKQLEHRIYELELETKWFKDLIRPVRVADAAKTKPKY